jgi:hypothetical protein
MLDRLTLRKTKNMKSYFRGSVVLHTLEHSRTDQIKCIVSQLQPARRREHEPQLAGSSLSPEDGGSMFLRNGYLPTCPHDITIQNNNIVILFVIYLTTLSVDQILQPRKLGRLMNNELERM